MLCIHVCGRTLASDVCVFVTKVVKDSTLTCTKGELDKSGCTSNLKDVRVCVCAYVYLCMFQPHAGVEEHLFGAGFLLLSHPVYLEQVTVPALP